MVSNTAPGLKQAPRPGTAPPVPAPGLASAPGSLPGPARGPSPGLTPGPMPVSGGPPSPVAPGSPPAGSPRGSVPGPSSPAAPGSPALPGPVAVPGLAHAPTAGPQAPTIPAHMLPHRTPAQLLAIARNGLAEAAQTRPEGLRYATAHLAALRAAAAVLAARARPAAPSSRRNRVTSVWSLLALVAPDFNEWASYFALGAAKRAAAEAGIPRVVSPREADDLLRAAEQFVTVVESALGLVYQPPLDQSFPIPERARAA